MSTDPSLIAKIYILAAGGIGSNAAPVVDFQEAGAAGLDADAQPQPLREVGKSLGIAMPRLASRFAQLAVTGACMCVDRLKGPLPQETPVYLATGLGDIARTDALYYQVMPPNSEAASPAPFATSGNNMAAFFVAQQAGLISRNVTLSSEDLSLEQVLACAIDDLTCGAASFALDDFTCHAARFALVGGVDETTVPREFYVRRYPLSADRHIGEGSAWLVLGTQAPGATGEILGTASLPSLTGEDDRRWASRAVRVIQSMAGEEDTPVLLPGGRISRNEADALRACQPRWRLHDYRDYSGCLPTAAAIALVGTFAGEGRTDSVYAHVNRDAMGRTGLIVWRVYPRPLSCVWP